MFMCEECNYIWEEQQRYIGDPEITHCPECGSAEIEETKPQSLPKADAYSLLADVRAVLCVGICEKDLNYLQKALDLINESEHFS